MSIDLYFSNRLEHLTEKLAAHLADEITCKSNKLDAPLIIVPNQNLAKWLKMTLARQQSVILNLQFEFLETGAWRLLQGLDPGGDQFLGLDHAAYAVVILKILQTLLPEQSATSPIGRYLQIQVAGATDDRSRRLWQLGQRLAYLFLEYELHRPDMIERWQAGLPAADEMERSQQEIYRKAGEWRKEMAHGADLPRISLLELAQRIIPDVQPEISGPWEPTWVHIFGLSQISDFHLRLIGNLQAFYPIRLYALNPSREFWEDLSTPGERRWMRKKKAATGLMDEAAGLPGQVFGQAPHTLLAIWGKAGREGVRRLCELTDYSFNACYDETLSDDSLLHRVQNTILTLNFEPGAPKPQDRSLQIFAAPSIFREVETVYHNICYNLERNDRLQLTDIAILVPDMSLYKPVFDGVFNRTPKALAYNLVDSRADIESLFAQAVNKILALAEGRFSRREVFELMLNPCFMSHWQISPAEIHDWANWAENLNIFHDYDQAQKSQKGYGDSPFFTWKLALQRLRLARILSPPEPAKPSARNYCGVEPFADMASGNDEMLEKFGLIIETLHDQVIRMNQGPMTGSRWKDVLMAAFDALLRIPAELKGEAAVQKDLLKALENLVLYDRMGPTDKDRHLDLGLVAEFIRSQLGAISGGHGDYLTHGVTICALKPMRPIPFQIMYVLGLEEGRFPGRAETSILDLRVGQPRRGDINLPERNCYLFLEMMLSVREKLYIGYVGRDLQKDRILPPCCVINQLRRYIEEEILPPGNQFQIAQIPLKGSSSKYLEPAALTDWSDIWINYSPADRLSCLRINDKWDGFLSRAKPAELARMTPFLPDFGCNRPPESITEGAMPSVTARQLANFLKDPIRQSLHSHLGLHRQEAALEDLILAEDEPFYSEFPLDYQIRMQSLRYWVEFKLKGDQMLGQNPVSAEDICQRLYERYQTQSRTPEGGFAELDKQFLMSQCGQMAGTLNDFLDQQEDYMADVRTLVCGDPGQDDGGFQQVSGKDTRGPLRWSLPPLDPASGPGAVVELSCRLPWVWLDSLPKWHVLILSGSAKPSKEPDKYLFEPFLSYLMARLSEPAGFEDQPVIFHIAYQKVVCSHEYRLETHAIREYLQNLVADYINAHQFMWLPFEVLRKLTVKPYRLNEEEVTDELRDQFAEELSEAFTQETEYLVRRLKPRVDSTCFDVVRKRFGMIYRVDI